VPDSICLIDKEHTITRINRAMANLFGIKPEEAIGTEMLITCVHHTDQPPAFVLMFNSWMTAKNTRPKSRMKNSACG